MKLIPQDHDQGRRQMDVA